MRRRAPLRLLLSLSVALPGALCASSAAAAPLTFSHCPASSGSGFSCAKLAVPLDRSASLPGTISLSVERRLAHSAPSTDAVVALAGGPGQAALPLAEFIGQAIAPALGTRDLLVFDQRGTGSSDPLRCNAFEGFSGEPFSVLFERCALEIGAARGGYTTQESVQDIEELRLAGGYEKLVLYGTSYGTKVALEYAERYPQNVEALLLDSVVPSDGPQPFDIPTFQAIAPVLSELCAKGACAGLTASPLGDIARLASRLRKHALTGYVFEGSGKRHRAALGEVDLLGILEAGDLNPALRALLPSAVRSALAQDPDPLLRLDLLSEGLIPNEPKTTTEGTSDIDEALFAATTCEDTPFPWQRSAPASTRRTEALAALAAEPAGTFYPFDATTGLENGLTGDCAFWPAAAPAPPASAPLPDVPTLILSGAQDLRTPTAGARRVAALIPDAQLEVVPFTGHSVIGSDLSNCAATAVSAFFSGAQVQPCAPAVNQFAPTPISPTRLADVDPPAGLRGRPGQTLVAVLDTLVDLNRQVIGATLQAEQELPNGSSFGGLRGGYARLSSREVVLHRFSFVPGVTLSGSFPVEDGELQASTISIGGSAASPGTVRVGAAAKHITGTLGGRRFDLTLAKVRLASAGSDHWPSQEQILSLLAGHGGERRHARRGGLFGLPGLP
jgi:pimeloyl-ACP methyl ester carboxylesterase